MHRPPAISFPVGRSVWHASLLAGGLLLALMAFILLTWSVSDGFPVWAPWVHGAIVMVCGAVSFFAWLRSPSGLLRWDGEHWLWIAEREQSDAKVSVVMDVQLFMLLFLRFPDHSSCWLWLDRPSMRLHEWRFLRRALVHSSHLDKQKVQSDDVDGVLS